MAKFVILWFCAFLFCIVFGVLAGTIATGDFQMQTLKRLILSILSALASVGSLAIMLYLDFVLHIRG